MAESLFASCVFVLMIPGKVRRPSAAARQSVCLYFGVCRRPLGTLACCPTFPALMSEQDHLTGRRGGGPPASHVYIWPLPEPGVAVVFQNAMGQSMIMR